MGLFSTMFVLAIVGAVVVRAGRWFEQRIEREHRADDSANVLRNDDFEHLIPRG